MNVQTAYIRLPWFAILSLKVIQISCRASLFVVGMIYSYFYRHNSFFTVFWVSVNIVLYQFTVMCIENWSVRFLWQWIMESKVYLLIIHARTKKKRFKIAIMFLGRRRSSREEWMDFWKQIYVVKEVFVYMYFAGFYLPLNPSATTVYARSAFYPSLRFTLSL